ncbi:DUF6059 family protein [Streptomyces sp. NPDC101776]|uniref:DUF6059 family protein n=1 Tax=Streptomyces sp. NPDC101776 TaxID=3366146 RepID=UPI003804B3E6
MIRSFPRRFLREVYRALVAHGTQYTGVHPEAAAPPAPAAVLTGPCAAHPERVCREVALTPAERALARELGAR